VIQRVTACCIELWRVAVCRSVLPCVAMYCSMLQCVAVSWIDLAVNSTVLLCVADLQFFAVCDSMWQFVAVDLQCVATCLVG